MKYKNITKKDLFLPGFGKVKAGEIIETKKEINNQNLEEIKEKPQEKQENNKNNS